MAKKAFSPVLPNISKKRVAIILPFGILALWGFIDWYGSTLLIAFSKFTPPVINLYSLVSILILLIALPVIILGLLGSVLLLLPNNKKYLLSQWLKWLVYLLLIICIFNFILGVTAYFSLEKKISELNYIHCFDKRTLFQNYSVYAKTPELCPKR